MAKGACMAESPDAGSVPYPKCLKSPTRTSSDAREGPDTNTTWTVDPGNSPAVPARRNFRRKPHYMLKFNIRHGRGER